MSSAAKEVFSNELIHSPRKILGEYVFYLESLSTPIKVRISLEYQPPQPEHPFHFETSVYIHTPTQAGPYITSTPWDATEEGALQRVINGFLPYYKSAIDKGHNPEESWLVKNNYY